MNRHTRTAFTLVELLVVITIIGMLVALLIPAVTAARAAAQQTQCINNQRNYGQALQEYVMAKDYFPGYRQTLAVGTGNYIVSWQIALMPQLGKQDVYTGIQNGSVTTLPYIDLATCPSDSTIVGRAFPYTSYVVNCGIQDQQGSSYPAYDSSANGLFMDRAMSPSSKVSLTDIKDGTNTTILLSENIDAYLYSESPITAFPASPTPTAVDNAAPNCSERGAGLLWWDISVPATLSAVNTVPGYKINAKKGDFDPSRVPFGPTNPKYFARPSSNHSGGVVVTFAGGNVSFQREDIDYAVYCSLMAPNNTKATFKNLPYSLPTLNEADYK